MGCFSKSCLKVEMTEDPSTRKVSVSVPDQGKKHTAKVPSDVRPKTANAHQNEVAVTEANSVTAGDGRSATADTDETIRPTQAQVASAAEAAAEAEAEAHREKQPGNVRRARLEAERRLRELREAKASRRASTGRMLQF
ncbi:hypothetical protein K458DRAFT_68060 [Lentithecium fluviatile CBS 122367]|uniref:Uncharacterized protein n=1 Tax=Lentithecium fluviatile CBS 122367 TaxID=1168545 RepID=A0A6G1JL04_9PLEO|nr:hypothetical protein K458DRAFT_68060 [Lentithecium fluviatile CBS 122367]